MIARRPRTRTACTSGSTGSSRPKTNAQVAEYFGEAPAQTKACEETVDKTHCTTYHALDQTYADQIAYWTTPTKDCGDDRGAVCKDYAAWTQAWTTVKG